MEAYYDDGNGIVIYHGDCRDVLPGLEGVDLVLTDPPYGVNGAQNTKSCRQRGRKNDYSLFADSVDYVRTVAVPVIQHCFFTGLGASGR